MKYFCLLMAIFLATACQTQTTIGAREEDPSREISSANSRGDYFEDVTAMTGVSAAPSSTIVVGDFDNDGWADFVADGRLYKNISTIERIQFVDVTERVHLQALAGNPMFFDVDNDGRLDILTTKGQLFHQRGDGTFEDVAKQYGLQFPENVYSMSFGDMNHDAFADLILGMAEKDNNGVVTLFPQKMFLNFKGKRFYSFDGGLDLQSLAAYNRGTLWADFNNDGNPDIYFSNYRLHRNYLMEVHGGHLVDSAAYRGVEGEKDDNRYFDKRKNAHFGPRYGHTIGAAWADFNNDGLLDLWVSNLVHKFVGIDGAGVDDIRGYLCDDSKIYKNLGAPEFKFGDVRAQSNIPPKPIGDFTVYKGDELWAHTTTADFDNDGLVDVYVSQVYDLSYAYSHLFKNTGNFTFKDVIGKEPIRVFDSYGAAWADFNNDGKMDLIVSGRVALHGDKKLRILKNIYNSENKYLKIRLVGTKSGRNPVTTQVRLFHKQGVFLRQAEGVVGTMNQQNDPVLHFGLGKVSAIDKIEIRWNSGKVQTLTTPKLNQTLTITEPQ